MNHRRTGLTFSAGLAATLAMSAGMAPLASAKQQQQIVIRVLQPDWGELADKWQQWIGDQFTKTHPGIKVEFDFVPGNQVDTKTILAVNSGHPPNLVVVYQDVAALAKKAVIQDLASNFKASGITPASFVKACWGTVLYNNEPYAFPAASTPGDVLWYNPHALNAAGISKPPSTWKQLYDDSIKAVKFGKNGQLERVGYELHDTDFNNYEGLWAGGNHLWKQTPQGWQPDPSNAYNIAFLKWMKKMADVYGGWAKYSKWMASDQAWNGPIDYLAQGKALFTLDGYWDYSGFAQYSPKFKYAATYAPTQHGTMAEQKAHPVTQWAVAFPKGQSTAEFNAAWQFAEWAFDTHSYMLGPTTNGSVILNQQKQWIDYTIKTLTGSQKLMANYLHYATDPLPYVTEYTPSVAITSYYQGQLTNAADAVLLGKKTPEQALADVASAVQTQLVISGQ